MAEVCISALYLTNLIPKQQALEIPSAISSFVFVCQHLLECDSRCADVNMASEEESHPTRNVQLAFRPLGGLWGVDRGMTATWPGWCGRP